ncbi:MAG: hypothetical protein ACK55I_50175, partial [bacterium]
MHFCPGPDGCFGDLRGIERFDPVFMVEHRQHQVVADLPQGRLAVGGEMPGALDLLPDAFLLLSVVFIWPRPIHPHEFTKFFDI